MSDRENNTDKMGLDRELEPSRESEPRRSPGAQSERNKKRGSQRQEEDGDDDTGPPGRKKSKKISNNPNRKQVEQIDPETNEVLRTFDSICQAGKTVGIESSGVGKALTGMLKTAGGFKWRYKGQNEMPLYQRQKRLGLDYKCPDCLGKSSLRKKVEQISKATGRVIEVFDSIAQAAAKLKIAAASISNIANGKEYAGKGCKFHFRFKINDSGCLECARLAAASRTERTKNDRKGPRNGKAVAKIDTATGKVVETYESCCAAARKTHIHPTSIAKVANPHFPQAMAGGFTWRLKKDSEESLPVATADAARISPNSSQIAKSRSTKKRPVHQVDVETGRIIATFTSRSEAARSLNMKSNNLGHVLAGRSKTAAGYAWKYATKASPG